MAGDEVEEPENKTEEEGKESSEPVAEQNGKDKEKDGKAEAATKDEKEDEAKTKDGTTDPKVLDAVAERLSFFFSDANARQDHFVRKYLVSDDEDCPAGHIPLEILLRFNTIKQHSTDPEVLVAAAKSEKLADKLVVSDDGKSIGRKVPFTNEMMNGHIPLTLVISNIPLVQEGRRDPKYGIPMDEVRELFTQYGTVTLTRFRFRKDGEATDDDLCYKEKNDEQNRRRSSRNSRRHALGSAVVEFETVEMFEKAAEDVVTSKVVIEGEGEEAKKKLEKIEPKRKLKLGDNELEVHKLQDYLDTREKKEAKKRKDMDKDGKDEKKAAEEVEYEPFSLDWKKGCVIKLKGVGEKCDREAILDAVAKGLGVSLGKVKELKVYADYSRGQVDGAIRFVEPENVEDLCKKISSGELEIAGAKVESATILDGEDEEKYWKEFIDFKNKQRQHRAEEKSQKSHSSRKRQRRR